MKAKQKRFLVKLTGWVLALSSLALIPWPENASWLWYPLLAVIVISCSIALDKIDNEEKSVTNALAVGFGSIFKFLGLIILALALIIGAYFFFSWIGAMGVIILLLILLLLK